MTRKRLSARDREHCWDDGNGICHICELPIRPGEAWEVSHPTPLAAGGDDTRDNRRPAHKACHAVQTATVDAPRIAKTRRQRQRNLGIKRTSSGFRGWRKFNGERVWSTDGG